MVAAGTPGSTAESLIEPLGTRELVTAQGRFRCTAYRDRSGGSVHLGLAVGQWSEADEVAVRVHEPLSVMDLLDAGSCVHSWPLPTALSALQQAGRGVAVLLNAGSADAETLLGRMLPEVAKAPAEPGNMDLRTYGVGAQILRHLGVRRMKLLGLIVKMKELNLDLFYQPNKNNTEMGITFTKVPPIQVGHQTFLSDRNPFGIKGVGEGGAVSPPAAIASAVADALAPLRVDLSEAPLHPERLFRRIQEAKQRGSA